MAERRSSLWHRLYHGETAYDFVGRKRTWFALSGVVVGMPWMRVVSRGSSERAR